MLTDMMNRTVTGLLCFLAVFFVSNSTYAEPKLWKWHAAGFRLTCLPYQDTALLEPYYLDHVPDDAQIPAFKKELAKQGVYFGDKIVNGDEETPLTTSCTLGNYKISVDFDYNSNPTMGIEDDGKFRTLVPRQHCSSVSYLRLKSLRVDGIEWYSNDSFAHDCLDNQVLRISITPKYKYLNVCTQSNGGKLEDAPLPIAYTPIQLDEQGNYPSPTVVCETISLKRKAGK